MRIGIDVGGTFNDVVLMYGGETHAANLVNSWPAEGTMATAFIPTSSAARYPRSK